MTGLDSSVFIKPWFFNFHENVGRPVVNWIFGVKLTNNRFIFIFGFSEFWYYL